MTKLSIRNPGSLGLLFLALLIVSPPGFTQPAPTIQFDSLLKNLRLDSTSHVLKFSGDVEAVFLPAGAEQSVEARLMFDDETVARFAFAPMRARAPFSRLSTRTVEVLQGEKKHSGYLVTGPGAYSLVFSYGDGEVFYRFPFDIRALDSDDPYDPQTYLFLEGPWQEWAHLAYQRDFPDAPVSLVIYKQLHSAETRRQDFDLAGTIECDGEHLGALSENAMIGTNRDRLQAYSNTFLYPVGDNLEYLPFSEFAKHSGECELSLTIGEEALRFPFELADGDFVGKQREGGPGKFFIQAQ